MTTTQESAGMQHLQSAQARAAGSEGLRCPECGTVTGGDTVRLPRLLRIALLLFALSIVLGPLIGGFTRFKRLPVQQNEPRLRYIEPPITPAELRRIAAGRQAPPAGFLDRLLEHRPRLLVQPPGEDELCVQWVDPSGWTSHRVEMGKPWRWLAFERHELYADLFRGIPHSARAGDVPLPPGGHWRWLGGALVHASWDSRRTAIVHVDRLVLVLLLPIAAALLVASRQRRRRTAAARSRLADWRRRGAALLLVMLVLGAWTALDLERETERNPNGIWQTWPRLTGRSAWWLRELQEQPGGAVAAAAAIAEAHPDAGDEQLLTVGYRQHSIPRHTGWRCGWPLRLLMVETVRRELTGPASGPGIWRPHPPRARLIDDRLVLVMGAPGPTDHQPVMQLYIGRLAVLVIGAFVVWSLARWLCLAPLRFRRWRRDRTGRCMRCGYRLRQPEAAIA